VRALPQSLRAASAAELKERVEIERRGVPFVLYRDGEGRQRIVAMEERQAPLRIGRQRAVDVPVDWDPEVSRVHAALERVGAEWTLVDDGSSRNGSFVNGERLHGRRRLTHGDLIRVGSSILAYMAPAGPTASPPTDTPSSSAAPGLSRAQRRVLVALCRPLVASRYGVPATNQQIAQELVLGVETIKTHIRALFEAFVIADLPQNQKRAELARQAVERGAVTEDELAADDRR
jgi:hypothetical protein